MKTMVMKFGGSSVADDTKLNLVAQRIVENKDKAENIVVVVSAQGKTTNNLISESESLSKTPNEREMDMLLSVGEQITASKLSILLNEMGYNAISLTGWQAGIKTNSVYENAKIETIYPARIYEELKYGKIVIVTGFQGINEIGDITTLGRGGSDTTAVGLAAALDAEECFIFSDVDGIYSADPHAVNNAKKIDKISFAEMQEISDAGAKVLHDRCIQIGERFDCNIIAKSTFFDGQGSKVCKKIETNEIKSIVNNSKIALIQIESDKNNESISVEKSMQIYNELLDNNVIINNYKHRYNIEFCILKTEVNKVLKILGEADNKLKTKVIDISKLSVIGYGITQDNVTLKRIIEILKDKSEILDVNLTQYRIEIIAKGIDDSIVVELHKKLISHAE
ncbi:MAG: aspartate kinase [Clostridia bacterium]|nr:aspartate kinase [Clostridia bacterium]